MEDNQREITIEGGYGCCGRIGEAVVAENIDDIVVFVAVAVVVGGIVEGYDSVAVAVVAVFR